MIKNCDFWLISTWISDWKIYIPFFFWKISLSAENSIFGYLKIIKPCRRQMEENYPKSWTNKPGPSTAVCKFLSRINNSQPNLCGLKVLGWLLLQTALGVERGSENPTKLYTYDPLFPWCLSQKSCMNLSSQSLVYFLKMRTSENRTTEIRRSQGPDVHWTLKLETL